MNPHVDHPSRRHFVVHMSPYRCVNGAWAGPYRVTVDGDQHAAIAAAQYMWSPERTVWSVEETDGGLDAPHTLAYFDETGREVARVTAEVVPS